MVAEGAAQTGITRPEAARTSSVRGSIRSTSPACDGMPMMYSPARAPPCHFHPPRAKEPTSLTSPVSGTILSADGALYGTAAARARARALVSAGGSD
eukprot:5299657-Prymnesium_polylepis.1